MSIQAIFWDGYNRIQGNLEIQDQILKFHFLDFSLTDLQLELSYNDILEVRLHSLFNKGQQGIEIVTKSNSVNIFIVEEPRFIRRILIDRVKIHSNLSSR